MFPMMTPIEAISYGLQAGLAFGQTQTLWATRMLEMQGFWLGFPALVSDLPKVSAAPEAPAGPDLKPIPRRTVPQAARAVPLAE